MRYIYSALFLLFFAFPGFAQQINVKQYDRVNNIGNGYCGHCAVETIARHYGVTTAKGHVVNLYNAGASGLTTSDDVCAALTKFKLSYFSQPAGLYRPAWLSWACKNQFLTIVGLNPKPGAKLGHYVVLVGYYTDKVAVIDSNNTSELVWYSREDFTKIWTGELIIVYPK